MSTNPITEAVTALAEALHQVDDLQVVTASGKVIVDPPAAVIGPPRLTFDAYNVPRPTSAEFRVALVVRESEHAAEDLYALVLVASEAIETHSEAVVTAADAGSWEDMPAYQLTVEMRV